jgi:hypothetical protein
MPRAFMARRYDEGSIPEKLVHNQFIIITNFFINKLMIKRLFSCHLALFIFTTHHFYDWSSAMRMTSLINYVNACTA